jgi:hypothetical protein
MTNYGKVKSFNRPKNIEVTNTTVFIASNITPCQIEVNDEKVSGFEYNYYAYTKDEYIEYLHNSLIDTQLALLEMINDVNNKD